MNKNTFIALLAVTLLPALTMAQIGLAPLNENQSYSIVAVTPDVRGNEKLESLNEKIKEKFS